MWYVVQTMTGKELELVGVIDKVLKGKGKVHANWCDCGESCDRKDDCKNIGNCEKTDSYKKCFVIQRECVWRLGGGFRTRIEPLFPSYVFVETNTPEEFFYALKRIPKLAKLLGGGGRFWSVQREEEALLRRLIANDPEYVVRRSSVQVNENGEIVAAEGVLKEHIGRIVKKRLRKRVVVIEIPFLGEMKRIEIGVKVDGKE